MKAEELTQDRVFEACIEALLFGRFTAPTPIEEIAGLCPGVWRRAVRVFEGDENAARDWMDSPSSLLADESPLLITLRVGGTRKVLQALRKMAGQARTKRAALLKRYKLRSKDEPLLASKKKSQTSPTVR